MLAALAAALRAAAPAPVVLTGYHLTARPWKPLAIPKDKYLDAIEGVCRYSIRHQDAEGAIIDPFLKREHQYATPYFAYATGALIHAGRAPDLLPYGVRAMDHATKCFAGGNSAIPDQHGNFFIAALAGALELYVGHVPESTIAAWRERLKKPRREIQEEKAINIGTEIDLDGDGQPDVRFSRECGFLLQLDRGKVIAIETDRAVTAVVRGRPVALDSHLPLVLSPSLAAGLQR